jgi:23S rRNA pseudouridine2605 synthase
MVAPMNVFDPQSGPAPDDDAEPPAAGERIAKRLARAGLCSRRDAERWVAEGRVSVNGSRLTTPAVVVQSGDIVLVDGKPLPEAEPTRLWRYYKPAGLVTTARDEKGRPTVFERLPANMPRVVSVGRLDLTTEGLLLLTNDGELARFLELPATGWIRRYRVRVHGPIDEARLAALAKGPTIDGVHYGPIEATLDRIQGSNAWLSVGIKEGKNREIRKVMDSLSLDVTRLIRTAFGPFQLGKLLEGTVEEVPKRVLKDQVTHFFGAPSAVHIGAAKTGTAKAGAGAAKTGTAKAKAGAAKTGTAKAGPGKTGAGKTGPAKPDGARPDGAKPGGAKPDGARPGGARPGGARPGAARANHRR